MFDDVETVFTRVATLFAAFEVATGRVKAAHKKRRRRKEFLEFMDEIVAAYPKKRLEVIVDNLNTHTRKTRTGWNDIPS